MCASYSRTQHRRPSLSCSTRRTASSSSTTGSCARGCGRGEPARMHAATLNANILPRRPRMMQPARLVSPCTRAPTPRAREMRVATLSALVCGRSSRARCRVASHTARSQRRARVSTCPSDDGPSTDWIGRAAGMARRPAGRRPPKLRARLGQNGPRVTRAHDSEG